MPKDGWTVLTVRESPTLDRAAEFLAKINKGKRYPKEKVSIGEFATSAIQEKLEREETAT